MAFAHQPFGKLRHGIARRICFALGGGPVQLFVVRQRMRVWSDNARMNQRRPFPLACEVYSSVERVVTRQQVTAIHFFDEEIRKGTNQLRDAAAGGIYFHRNRDGVAVVLDQIDGRQLEVRGGVERFPEFTFTRLAFTGRDEHDFVLLESFRDVEQLRAKGGFGRPDALQKLRSRRRRRRDDVVRLMSPVARHLASAGRGIDRGAHCLVQHFRWSHAEGQAEGAVAVISVEPIVRRLEDHSRRGQNRFVAGS